MDQDDRWTCKQAHSTLKNVAIGRLITLKILLLLVLQVQHSSSVRLRPVSDQQYQQHFDFRQPISASASNQQPNNHSSPSNPIGWSPRAGTIRLIRLDTPSQAIEGQPIKLRCLHESRGDRLQSLSWSRNGREFYRYQPFERNSRQQHLFFNSSGIHPDIQKSRNNTVVLTNTTVDTSGRYRCEVTGSQFQEVKLETYINVTVPNNARSSFHRHFHDSTIIQILIVVNTFVHISILLSYQYLI